MLEFIGRAPLSQKIMHGQESYSILSFQREIDMLARKLSASPGDEKLQGVVARQIYSLFKETQALSRPEFMEEFFQELGRRLVHVYKQEFDVIAPLVGERLPRLMTRFAQQGSQARQADLVQFRPRGPRIKPGERKKYARKDIAKWKQVGKKATRWMKRAVEPAQVEPDRILHTRPSSPLNYVTQPPGMNVSFADKPAMPAQPTWPLDKSKQDARQRTSDILARAKGTYSAQDATAKVDLQSPSSQIVRDAAAQTPQERASSIFKAASASQGYTGTRAALVNQQIQQAKQYGTPAMGQDSTRPGSQLGLFSAPQIQSTEPARLGVVTPSRAQQLSLDFVAQTKPKKADEPVQQELPMGYDLFTQPKGPIGPLAQVAAVKQETPTVVKTPQQTSQSPITTPSKPKEAAKAVPKMATTVKADVDKTVVRDDSKEMNTIRAMLNAAMAEAIGEDVKIGLQQIAEDSWSLTISDASIKVQATLTPSKKKIRILTVDSSDDYVVKLVWDALRKVRDSRGWTSQAAASVAQRLRDADKAEKKVDTKEAPSLTNLATMPIRGKQRVGGGYFTQAKVEPRDIPQNVASTDVEEAPGMAPAHRPPVAVKKPLPVMATEPTLTGLASEVDSALHSSKELKNLAKVMDIEPTSSGGSFQLGDGEKLDIDVDNAQRRITVYDLKIADHLAIDTLKVLKALDAEVDIRAELRREVQWGLEDAQVSFNKAPKKPVSVAPEVSAQKIADLQKVAAKAAQAKAEPVAPKSVDTAQPQYKSSEPVSVLQLVGAALQAAGAKKIIPFAAIGAIQAVGAGGAGVMVKQEGGALRVAMQVFDPKKTPDAFYTNMLRAVAQATPENIPVDLRDLLSGDDAKARKAAENVMSVYPRNWLT